eukprot:9934291-Lingulodinium_polyedra.AAC.1
MLLRAVQAFAPLTASRHRNSWGHQVAIGAGMPDMGPRDEFQIPINGGSEEMVVETRQGGLCVEKSDSSCWRAPQWPPT